MPNDRDFICFGTPYHERTIDERAWEAELDLLGGYPGLVARTLREHFGSRTVPNTPLGRRQLLDDVAEFVYSWSMTNKLAPGLPGYVVSSAHYETADEGGVNGVRLEVQLFEGLRTKSVTVEADLSIDPITHQVVVRSRVARRGYNGGTLT